MGDTRFVTRLLLLSVVLIGSPFLSGYAQNLAQHNWFFGNSKNAIRFNRATNKAMLVTDQATPFGTGGSAVATDPATADLFFYTDGNNVFDATHAIMPGGTGLSGNTTANQPVAVCAIPGQLNKYFVFTNSANFTTPGTVSVSVVDLTAFGNSVFPSPPLGVVAAKNTPITGLANVSEGMIIVPHSNKTDFWLITQANGTTTYNATLINAASFTAGTFTTTATTGLGKTMTVANFSYSSKLKKLCVSPQITGTDLVILDFDNTGAATPFTFDSFISNSGTTTTGNQSIYDAQWDNGGRYLYFSRTGDTGVTADVLQFDALNPSFTLASILPAPVFRSYGLQLGPDSAMYHLFQATAGGPFLIDKFTKTDTIASSVIHGAAPLGAGIDFAGTQFPEFLPLDKVKQTVDFTFNSKPNCQNTVTSFYPDVTPNADSLKWTFGDGKDTTTWSPNHTYTTSGSMSVTLRAFYQGQEKDTTKTILISPFALKLTLVSDTTACECQLPARQHLTGSCSLPNFSVTVKVSGGTAASYLWNDKETTATLHPDSAGYYYVVVKDASGCSAYAGVNVKEFELQDMRENIWYFGNHAGIDFNPPTGPKAISTSAMDAPAGCAIACDRNGQVIIYTDGDQVWDKNNAVIATGIGGSPKSAQSSIIIPVSGDETLYYIFTTQAIDGTSNNEMRYSLYDLKKDSVVIQNVLLFSKSTEHLTGNSNWVVAHEYGNNTFRAYPVSIKGIGDPVYSAAGSDHSFEVLQNGQGYMKLGGNQNKNNLAVALSTPGTSNWVELFDFADSSGVISNYRKIDLKTTAGQVYGVEFSPGGNKIFATVDGLPKPSFLFEYSIDSVGQTHLKNKTSVDAELGAIQIAPNGQVYVAVNDAAHNASLGVIAANDDTTRVSVFTLNGFPLAAGTNSLLGLPNFRQQQSNAFGGPTFTFNGVCVGDTTHFSGQARDPIDKFQWNFGDGGSSTVASPDHLYAAAGTYKVVMVIYNRCPNSRDSVVQSVVVNPPPPKPTLPASSALCNGPLILDANANNLPSMTYLWSTGDTTRKVTLTHPTFSISVTNTDKNGCTSNTSGAVGDARPKVDFGPDQTICQDTQPAPILRAGTPGATYVWTVPAGVTPSPIDSAKQLVSDDSIATLTPQKYKVVASIVIALTTCTNSDSIVYTINPTPTFLWKGINPSGGCGSPSGTLTLSLLTPTVNLSSYVIFGDTTLSGQDQASGAVIVDNKARAGSYSASVSDQVSQCTATKTIALTDLSVSLSITPRPITTCDSTAISATTTVAAPFNYTVKNSAGVLVDTKSNVGASPFSTKRLTPGFYTVVVRNAAHCTASDTVTVQKANPLFAFSVTPALCPPTQTLTAATLLPGTPTYTWTGPGITAGNPGSVLTISPGAGSFTYTVTGTLAGYCPATYTVPVLVPPTYVPDFTSKNNCTTQATITATPAGNFTYLWYLQDPTTLVFSLVGSGPQILANATGTYRVDVSDNNGCTVSSPTHVVNVYGDLQSGITATQACADDSPFTLTATTNASTAVTYTWFLNNTIVAGASSSTLVQMQKSNTPDTYKVRILSPSTGCKDSSTLIVIPAPIPVGNLPSTALICDDPTNTDITTSQVTLRPGNSFTTYNWFLNSNSLSVTDSTYIAKKIGLYRVDLTNVFGCKGSDQTVVSSECEPIIAAPTAFRPGSNIFDNQKFEVITKFVSDQNFGVFIFNRWGELIYTSNQLDFKWNGTMSRTGEPTPGGTYAYVIKYVGSDQPEKGIQEKHGGVVLLR